MIRRILVTGATGQVGSAVMAALQGIEGIDVRAGVRDVAAWNAAHHEHASLQAVHFDFADPASQDAALAGCNSVFLLRPPQLTGDFGELIARAQAHGVGHIVFLSVEGADKNVLIPHHKIEQRLMASGLAWTMLRPAYFMQNFTSTLRGELVQRRRIFLPAGNARFTLVDVEDIGRVAAQVLTQPGTQHHGQAYTLTASKALTFHEMAAQLSLGLGRPITYESPGPWHFWRTLRSDGKPAGLIFVMLLLHMLPRWMGTPPVTNTIAELTGHRPVEFAQFVAAHQNKLA